MVLENFERFTKKGRSYVPKMSIRKRGQVGFNTGAIVRFGLEKYNYVVLFISKERDKMAIKFTNDENEEGAIKIMKRPGNFAFSGKAFFDLYEIPYDKTKTYDIEWVENEHVAIINLKT